MPGLGHRVGGGILVRHGAVVAGDRPRAVLVANLTQFVRDLVQRLRTADFAAAAVCICSQRGENALRVVLLLGQLPSFQAGVTPVKHIVGIGFYRQQAVVLNLGFHGAVGVTEPAIGFYCFARHGSYSPVLLR